MFSRYEYSFTQRVSLRRNNFVDEHDMHIRDNEGGDSRDGNAIFVASLVRYGVHVEIPRPLLFPFPSLDNNRDPETMTRSA